jgi:hypothetical protein
MSGKSEKGLKRFLKGLSNEQIKKLVDGIDVSPFPVLLASEYEKRFGQDKYTIKKIRMKINKEMRNEQNKQGIILNNLKNELDIIKNTRVSERGLNELSEKSITQIQDNRTDTLTNIQKNLGLLIKSSTKITELESKYISSL